MRFMIIREGDKDTEAGVLPSDTACRDGEVHRGDGQGRHDARRRGTAAAREGGADEFPAGSRRSPDGPLAKTKELIAGSADAGEVEAGGDGLGRALPPSDPMSNARGVRQVFEAEDFGAEFTPERGAGRAAARRDRPARERRGQAMTASRARTRQRGHDNRDSTCRPTPTSCCRRAPRGHAHRTPVLTSRTATTSRRPVFFKCENLQRIGAFKFRGAYNALSRFDPRQRAAGVVAFSSGNHAQAIALRRGCSASRRRS